MASGSNDLAPVIRQALQDNNPLLLRRAGLELLEYVAPEQRWALAHEHLRDPIRSFRILTVAALAPVAGQNLTVDDIESFEQASNEYLTSLQWNADDPAAQVNLGNFYSARNKPILAEQAYRAALDLDPEWLPAYINLVDHLRVNNRDSEGEAVLQQGLQKLPNSAALHHSLGLLAIRQKQLPQALASLKQAVMLELEDSRFSIVYAALLINLGLQDEARIILKAALDVSPDNTDLHALNTEFGD